MLNSVVNKGVEILGRKAERTYLAVFLFLPLFAIIYNGRRVVSNGKRES